MNENTDCLDISVVILTYNEELHIRRCLENVKKFSKNIFIVDSFSTDKTVDIAREYGAVVLQHKWENNYAKQFNWGLDNCPIDTKWVLRLDADEYLYPETILELYKVIPSLPDSVSSLSLNRVRVWMGKQIKRGCGKIILKRFFRFGIGRCEERMMDEHIVTDSGQDYLLKGVFADDNLNNLSWWAHKHVDYAVREAVDLLNIKYKFLREPVETEAINKQAFAKRLKKIKYSKLPLFWRAFLYFCVRYFLKGGFLEGKEGFCWHFFQGLWYRMLVDAKVFEIEKLCGSDTNKICCYVEKTYNIALR